jgi:hypothetical protein
MQAVNEMADLVQFSIPKSVSLSLNLERRLPLVSMDPGQLQQILMNLVINAGETIGDGNFGRARRAGARRQAGNLAPQDPRNCGIFDRSWNPVPQPRRDARLSTIQPASFG